MSRRRIRVNHRSHKTRKDSKTLPIYGTPDRGDGLDNNRYWECWFCRFICDADRDELGDSESRARIALETYALVDDVGSTTGYCSVKEGADQTACEAAGGTWITTRHRVAGGTGCSFCHSTNWRGDF